MRPWPPVRFSGRWATALPLPLGKRPTGRARRVRRGPPARLPDRRVHRGEARDDVLSALGPTAAVECLAGSLNYIVRVASTEVVEALTPNSSDLGSIDVGRGRPRAVGHGLGKRRLSRDRAGPRACRGRAWGRGSGRRRIARLRPVGRRRRRPRDRSGPHGARAVLGPRARQGGGRGPAGGGAACTSSATP